MRPRFVSRVRYYWQWIRRRYDGRSYVNLALIGVLNPVPICMENHKTTQRSKLVLAGAIKLGFIQNRLIHIRQQTTFRQG